MITMTNWVLVMLLLAVSTMASAADVTLRFSDVPPVQVLPSGRKVYAMSRHRANAAMAVIRHDGADVFSTDARRAAGAIAQTRLVRTIVLQSGSAHAGSWQPQQRELAAESRAGFGRATPRVTGIVLASDTDNTGEHVQVWFGDVTLTPEASSTMPETAK